MSDLTNLEKRKFEQLLDLGTGYVLNFSNRTFHEFVFDSTGRNPYDARYDHGSSKANRLRGFWQQEGNGIVGKLMSDMLDYGTENDLFTDKNAALLDACRRIVTRLLQDTPVTEADALAPISDDRDFDTVAKAVREAIEKNEPESGLDRLHTFVIKYVRTLCTQHGLAVARDKPLHSLFGEYVKRLRDSGHIESEMAARILKSSISTLQAFNDVRNNQKPRSRQPDAALRRGAIDFQPRRELHSLSARRRKQNKETAPTGRIHGRFGRYPVLDRQGISLWGG